MKQATPTYGKAPMFYGGTKGEIDNSSQASTKTAPDNERPCIDISGQATRETLDSIRWETIQNLCTTIQISTQ